MTKQQALDRVVALSRKIDKGELSLEQWKYARAEAMADASAAGATHREIAKAAGFKFNEKTRKSNGVMRNIAVHHRYGDADPKPSWKDAFDEVTGFDRDAAQERTDKARAKKWITDAPAEHVEHMLTEQRPDLVQKLRSEPTPYQEARETQRQIDEATPLHEHKAGRAAAEKALEPIGHAIDTTSIGLAIAALEDFTAELHVLNENGGAVSPRALRRLEEAWDAASEEMEVARMRQQMNEVQP